MDIFSKFKIAVSGSHKGYSQINLEKLVVGNGGTYIKTMESGVTHLVTTQADIEKKSSKVRVAQAAGLYLVSSNWLLESIEVGKALAEKDFLLDAAVAPAPISASDSVSSGASKLKSIVAPRAGIRASKRTASNLTNMDANKDGGNEPTAKRVKAAPKTKSTPVELEAGIKPTVSSARSASKHGVEAEESKENKMDIGDDDAVEESVAKKPRAVRKGEKSADEVSIEEQEPTTRKYAKGKGKGKGKAKKEVTPDLEVEEGEEEEEEEEKPKMKTIIKKGKAPVDELCPDSHSVHVYVDSNGTVYDATLNQTDIRANNNKFYYCQLLEADSRKEYSVWVRYGRVGERGQTKMYVNNVNFGPALVQFEKLFRSKTGYHWDDRTNAHGGPGKYAFLERNYEEDEEAEPKEKSRAGGSTVMTKSRLTKPLQSLMQLIFNTAIMQQSMASLSYDSNKLPLGKLSKEVISRGFQTLKDIGEVIDQKHGFLQKFAECGNDQRSILQQLSNRYYTVIPHSFGRSVPPVIDSGPKLKKEVELIENLGDMALTTKIMAETNVENSDGIHQLDKQFDSLGLNEAVPLDKSTTEFKNLEAYVKKTQGQTHYMKLTVEDIFRVTRSGEDDRWQADGWDKYPNDNRHLLWHGSRTTNFAGILSQGLRIAPPEAPVNGYMFGKGIYLADIVTKSANYCCASSSNNTGLLLLCEAQLGDPMFELNQADYMAAENCKKQGALATKGLGRSVPLKWEDASVVHDNLKGIKMPAVTAREANITGDDPSLKPGNYRSLQYNEYIVYNTSQVKIRYLFRCQFSR